MRPRQWVQRVFQRNKIVATGTVLVAALGGVVGVAAGAGGVANASDPNADNPDVSIHGTHTICNMDGHIVTITRVDIRNNNFSGEPMCLTNYYYKPIFKITSSGLHEPWAAFPNAFVGCEISVCTPHSPMPIQVSNIRQAYSTWHYHPGGPWQGNAAYDIWFNPRPMTLGQINHGAEIMIWLNQSGIGGPAGTPVYIDGTWWKFTTWVTSHGGRTWNYIRFWRMSPTLSVTNLNLKPFMQYAEARHRLSSTWWLTSVEAGYELWRGGVGMSTLWYSVDVTPWRAPTPPPAPKPTPTTPKPTPKPTPTLPVAPKPTPLPTTPTPAPSSTPVGTSTPTVTPTSSASPTPTSP